MKTPEQISEETATKKPEIKTNNKEVDKSLIFGFVTFCLLFLMITISKIQELSTGSKWAINTGIFSITIICFVCAVKAYNNSAYIGNRTEP